MTVLLLPFLILCQCHCHVTHTRNGCFAVEPVSVVLAAAWRLWSGALQRAGAYAAARWPELWSVANAHAGGCCLSVVGLGCVCFDWSAHRRGRESKLVAKPLLTQQEPRGWGAVRYTGCIRDAYMRAPPLYGWVWWERQGLEPLLSSRHERQKCATAAGLRTVQAAPAGSPGNQAAHAGGSGSAHHGTLPRVELGPGGSIHAAWDGLQVTNWLRFWTSCNG